MFGVSLTALQWFMHFYLPYKIENASEVMGSLGVTFATLGYLFFIGRIMAGTLVLNAVLFERAGEHQRARLRAAADPADTGPLPEGRRLLRPAVRRAGDATDASDSAE